MRSLVCALLGPVLWGCLPCRAFAASASAIPPTGDTFPMYTWIAVMILALLALIAAIVFFGKSMKK